MVTGNRSPTVCCTFTSLCSRQKRRQWNHHPPAAHKSTDISFSIIGVLCALLWPAWFAALAWARGPFFAFCLLSNTAPSKKNPAVTPGLRLLTGHCPLCLSRPPRALIGFNSPGLVAPHTPADGPGPLFHLNLGPSVPAWAMVSAWLSPAPSQPWCPTCWSQPWPMGWLPSWTSDLPPHCRTWMVVTRLSRTLAAATRPDPALPT